MIIQQRDLDLLIWINGFGFANASQIQTYLNVCSAVTYRRINKLISAGYLVSKNILHGHQRIYILTNKAVTLCADSIPANNNIRLGTFHHDLTLVDLSLYLEKKYSGEFEPARRIRHNYGLAGFGNPGHIADGYLHIGDYKPIAIELEISLKSHQRLKNIILNYASNLSLREVWYFTDKTDVKRAISKLSQDFDFIKTLPLPENMRIFA
jgi:hypothetical protein